MSTTTPDERPEETLSASVLVRFAGSEVDNLIGDIKIRARENRDAPRQEGARTSYDASRFDLAAELIRLGHELLVKEDPEPTEEER